ncbi:unnamed protein product [Calicophoron daubneyi]|uniref:Saccharopine dehydrogenase (NAD(+), L-glutamate-forming) n=1 Tax=Calicophoron daubneyi TaxID=300641 RepID=A0AAV2TMW0_CALDB
MPSGDWTRYRIMHGSNDFKPIVGIKRETVNLWEQRTPLTPRHVRELVHSGVRVLVQPSNRRCYSSQEFEEVGAVMQEDLSPATVIFGVKRPVDLRPEDLLPDKTYCFFSHTTKAQPSNMTLLDTLLERRIRLLDYEHMVDDDKKRLVAFGRFAGIAGTIDILHGLGMRLLALGHTTPFLNIGLAHNYRRAFDAQQAFRSVGYDIALGWMPDSLGPMIFVIHGDGNVSEGAQLMLEYLPIKWITVEQLQETAENGDKRTIYACVVSVGHYMEHVDGKPFVLEEYFAEPQKYESRFIEKVAPYMSVLINATYWDKRVARILTRSNVKSLMRIKPNVKGSYLDEACPTLPQRLIAICDISADPGGSVEFTDEVTTIEEPFVVYDPQTDKTSKKMAGPGILMCSIDNMPAQLPMEASEYFGDALSPYISDIIKSNAKTPFSAYNAHSEVKNAFVTSNGALTPRFEYITELRKKQTAALSSSDIQPSKQILVLGAGFVVPSLLRYLTRNNYKNITVVSNIQHELDVIAAKFPEIKHRKLNVLEDHKELGALMEEHDLVISMIPWKFHPVVAELCIKHKRNLLTASYCTPVLKEMEPKFQEAGITAFMEIGLDPGIDHLLTKECVDEVHKQGGKIVSYRSFTGGLPAPEDSDNPLRYKFSWSPEAAMSTVKNGAKYLENGKIVEIPADGSLMTKAVPMNICPGFNFEGYPNRDSTKYISQYGLNGCQTIIRGTLRYRGFSDAVRLLLSLGLLDAEPHSLFKPGSDKLVWRELICQKLDLPKSLKGEDLRAALLKKFSGDEMKYECLRDLGLLSEDEVKQTGTPLSSISEILSRKLSYGSSERDLIVMSHELVIDWPERRQRETRKVNLVVYGDADGGKAGMAMSRTVGIPAAIAARMLLEGRVVEKGIVLPLQPYIYKPIIEELKDEGIEARETSIFTQIP